MISEDTTVMKERRYIMKVNETKGLVVVFVHTNYSLISGGTEKFVRQYNDLLQNEGYNTLSFFPIESSPPFIKEKLAGVIYNGRFEYITYYKEIPRLIDCYLTKNSDQRISVCIQHLKNHDFNMISNVIQYYKAPTSLFVHDYYMLCVNSRLINSKGLQCGFTLPNSEKCDSCVYGLKAMEHSKNIRAFIECIKPYLYKVFTPSEFVKEVIVNSFSSLQGMLYVRPHLCFCGKKEIEAIKDDKIKLAYVGAQIRDKGYYEWKKIVEYIKLSCPDDYELYYFGYGTDKTEGVTNIYVAESSGQKMEIILQEYDISCALFWSLCGETYSYTYYEMLASGVFVLTNKVSGNVAYEVGKNHSGIIFDSIEDCKEWLSDTVRCKNEINMYRKKTTFPACFIPNSDIDISFIVWTGSHSTRCTSKKIKKNYYATALYRLKHFLNQNGEK